MDKGRIDPQIDRTSPGIGWVVEGQPPSILALVTPKVRDACNASRAI